MPKEIQNEEPRGLPGKRERLFDRLRELDSLLVAFSGGADSAYLAWAAHQTLGERALSITALSPSFSAFDREQAESFARHVGLRHESIATHEFENSRYVANNADRCYHCKIELFVEMEKLASARNFAALAYGVNTDDMQDFRPGHRAARGTSVRAVRSRTDLQAATRSATPSFRCAADLVRSSHARGVSSRSLEELCVRDCSRPSGSRRH